MENILFTFCIFTSISQYKPLYRTCSWKMYRQLTIMQSKFTTIDVFTGTIHLYTIDDRYNTMHKSTFKMDELDFIAHWTGIHGEVQALVKYAQDQYIYTHVRTIWKLPVINTIVNYYTVLLFTQPQIEYSEHLYIHIKQKVSLVAFNRVAAIVFLKKPLVYPGE